MNDGVDIKMAAYMKIIRVRRTAIAVFFLPPILFILLGNDSILIFFGIGWMVVNAVFWFLLMICDICPWCKHRFFVKGTDTATVFDYLARTQCANCREPFNKE